KAKVRSTVSGPQVEALRNYISRKYRVAYDATAVLVSTVYKVAREKELDPLLLLAVIAIESRYNPFAESSMGAQGLMQVMTRVHQDKFDKLGDGLNNPLDPIANIRVGTTILRDCIDRRGSIEGGLACYVGATGPGDGGYGAKVQAERRRLALAAGIALARDWSAPGAGLSFARIWPVAAGVWFRTCRTPLEAGAPLAPARSCRLQQHTLHPVHRFLQAVQPGGVRHA